jgi:hypothetical protein
MEEDIRLFRDGELNELVIVSRYLLVWDLTGYPPKSAISSG